MRNKKRFECAAMSLALMLTMIPNSMSLIFAADEQNLALHKSAIASNFEVPSTDAAKAVDGDLKTHWGTERNKASGEWLEVDLGSMQTIQQINVIFERADDQQNILGYKVEIFNGTTYDLVYTKNEKAKQKEEIVLSEAVKGSKVKVTILQADGGPMGWVNAGISELEVYDHQVIEPETEENVNHIANAKMAASNVEDNLERLNADKTNDGDKATRWASNYDQPATQWLKATFPKPTKLQQFNVYFLNRDIAPNNSNVERFSIRYTDENGEEKYAVQDYANTSLGTNKGYQTNVKIVLDEPILAQDVTICDFDAKATSYNNISITEFEAYANEVSNMSLDDVVASIKGKEITNDVTKLPMPSAPDAFNIAIHGADFEQIVAADGTIHHPLTDKVVKISFEVTELKTGKSKVTNDIDFVIKGDFIQAEDMNAKPVIMPEIAEWYSESTEILPLSTLHKVTYDDANMEKNVDEFIQDYATYTGITLEKEQSDKAQVNAMHFSLQNLEDLQDEEGYIMDIQADRILVQSSGATGNMYGMQTILQMFKANAQGYPIGIMRDYPKFKTRGFLLDVARKAISMDMLKDMSRTMRYYKMNDFQVHLSDNYIFLENYGYKDKELEAFKAYDAFRLESSLSNDAGETPTALDYAYTKDEFRNFIKEERESGMKIVPEIDVPAHANSFTKIWPEIMVKNKVSPMAPTRPLVDHIDVSKPEAMDKIEEIFDDYTKGENPVFDADTTVHIGADEFLADYTAYRNFVNELVPYVKDTNTVRMWGGLTWIDDKKTEIIPEAIENVELNLWSSDWADGRQMYDMGYKLINTIDDYTYMVPNGSGSRANSYGDLLNINRIFDSFEANRVKTRSGYQVLPSGDEQVLGAAFAMWHDNIDKHASGLSESDMFYRFFDAMPFFAEKTWAATGKEKGSAAAVSALSQEQGLGPNSNPYSEEEKVGTTYESYDFADNLQDTSENDRDLIEGSAIVENEALHLQGDDSYVTSPIQKLGIENTLAFDITLTTPATPGQVLFESDAAYGTHDIRIMADGTLGFTRELYEYSFEYTLPVGKTVRVEIVNEKQKTQLYIDGSYIGNAVGKFIDKGIEKKNNIGHSTFELPLQRIGSSSNAIEAIMDNIVVSENMEKEDVYQKAIWTGKTNTETVYNDREGLLKYAFDNNPGTIWHSNWQGATDKLTGSNSFYAELDLGNVHALNQFAFTPRQDAKSGYVTKADLFVKENADDAWVEVAKDQTFAPDGTKKTFHFDEQNVRYVKFVAKASNDGWVAMSEFDVDNRLPSLLTVYVTSDGNGTVNGGKDVMQGEEVQIEATPATGYQFDGWYKANGELVSNEAAYSFVVDANTALIARFTKCSYEVVIDGETQTVEYGDKAEIHIPKKPGYKWVGFFEANSDVPFDFANPIDRNVTVESKFVPYAISVLAAQNGTLCVSAVNEQGETTLSAKAGTGYVFDGWYVDGVLLSKENVYTFIADKDMLIAGIFKKETASDVETMRTVLSAAIEKAQKLKKEGALNGVHDSVAQKFETSLTQAVNVYRNTDASANDITSAWFNLAEAMHYLDFKADKTKLANLYDEYSRIDLTLYKDDENKANFIAALELADTTIQDKNALQERIDQVYNALLDAKTNLVLHDEYDVTLLDYFINTSDQVLLNEKYFDTTLQSWTDFVNALDHAKQIRTAMPSQEAIDTAAKALADAYEDLRLIANEDVLAQLQKMLQKVRSIQLTNYAPEDVALFQSAETQLTQMIETGYFTMRELQDVMQTMTNVEKRMQDGVLSKDSETPFEEAEVVTKPAEIKPLTKTAPTGDQTNVGVLFSTIAASGCLVCYALKNKKKKAEK